jgi:hypothetical protein
MGDTCLDKSFTSSAAVAGGYKDEIESEATCTQQASEGIHTDQLQPRLSILCESTRRKIAAADNSVIK